MGEKWNISLDCWRKLEEFRKQFSSQVNTKLWIQWADQCPISSVGNFDFHWKTISLLKINLILIKETAVTLVNLANYLQKQ